MKRLKPRLGTNSALFPLLDIELSALSILCICIKRSRVVPAVSKDCEGLLDPLSTLHFIGPGSSGAFAVSVE